MADPFSIIGLLATAATLTKTVLDFASAVKDAPKEAKTLSRELTSLHDVNEQLVDLLENDDSREDFSEISTLYNAAGVRIFSFIALRSTRSLGQKLHSLFPRCLLSQIPACT